MRLLNLVYLFIIVISSFTISGCGFDKVVNNKIDYEMAEVKKEIFLEKEKAKSTFVHSYKNILNINKNTLQSNTIKKMYSHVIETSDYMDSLSIELEKMDYRDPKYVDSVSVLFVKKGAGAFLFEKMKSSYLLMEEVAVGANKDSIINHRQILFDNLSKDEWTKRYFNMTEPFGATIISYSLQTELYKYGTLSLEDKK